MEAETTVAKEVGKGVVYLAEEVLLQEAPPPPPPPSLGMPR